MKAKLLVALVVVIVSLGLTACASSPVAPTPVPPTPSPVPPTPTPVPPTPSITVEDLSGIWRGLGPISYGHIQLNPDGTYRIGRALPYLEKSPTEIGEFRLEGTLLTFIPSNQSQECAGQRGSYQVQLTEPDQLQMALQDDPCQYRANHSRGPWERVAP